MRRSNPISRNSSRSAVRSTGCAGALRRRRRPTRRVQHSALQRKDPRALRHQRHDGRSLRNPRQSRQNSTAAMRGSKPSSTRSTHTHHRKDVPDDKIIQMARLGVVLDEFIAANDLHAHRDPMLDESPAELGLQRLHLHEHDVRKAHAQRLRNRHHRGAVDVRAVARVATAQRAGRLEQQLRRR